MAAAPLSIAASVPLRAMLVRRLLKALVSCVAIAALFCVVSMSQKPAHAASMPGGSFVPTVAVAKTDTTADTQTRPVGTLPQRTMSLSVDAMWQWIITTHACLNRALTDAVRGLKQDPWQGSLLLVALAFAYGVLHAAGPGHGKAVIASYVLANGATVRRGVALSFLAAGFQALAALVLVGVLVLLMAQSARSALALERWLEIASWGLIAFVGAWLLWRQLAPILGAPIRRTRGADCGCPDPHLPPAHLLTGEWSWSRAVAIAISVGIRPCTGANLLLTFAIGQGLFWAGVLGTLAMALGTALTVSTLALIAVYARHWSIALWGRDSRIGSGVARAFTVIAAVLVIAIGLAGTHAALTAPRPHDHPHVHRN